MKKTICILMIMAFAHIASANDFGFVTWEHGAGTPTTNEVLVSAIWWQQFPDRDDSQSRHLCIATTPNFWQSLTTGQKTYIKGRMAKLFNGEIRVTKATLTTWVATLNANGVAAELVLPNETPTPVNKLYFIVSAKTEDAPHALGRLGITEPPIVD